MTITHRIFSFTLAIAFAVVMVPLHAQTSKLDAPIITKPTVRSEIKRGESAAIQCMLKSSLNYSVFMDCLNADQYSNEQKNTKSNPYLLGLSISAVDSVSVLSKHGLTNGQENAWLRIWKKDIARIVKAYKLTDKDLCGVFSLNCEEVERIVSSAK